MFRDRALVFHPSLRERLPLAATLALALLSFSVRATADDAEFAKIRGEMQRQRDAVQSMLVEYEESWEPLIDELPLFRQGSVNLYRSSRYIEWFTGDRLVQEHFVEEKPFVKVSAELQKDEPKAARPRRRGGQSLEDFFKKTDFAAFKKACENVAYEKSDRLLVWDGMRLIERIALANPDATRNWNIRPAPKQPMRQFQETYFDRVGWGRHDPGLEPTGILSDRDRWPQALAEPGYTLLAEREMIDGANCVVVESKNAVKLWLDPDRGYVVMRRHLWRDGQKAFEFEYSNIEEIAAGAWMPLRVELYWIASAAFPEEFVGQRTGRSVYTIARREVNETAHADLKWSVPSPGDAVFDSVLPPLDDMGQPIALEPGPFNPSVFYRQPPDGVDPRPTIKEAQRAAGARVKELRSQGKIK